MGITQPSKSPLRKDPSHEKAYASLALRYLDYSPFGQGGTAGRGGTWMFERPSTPPGGSFPVPPDRGPPGPQQRLGPEPRLTPVNPSPGCSLLGGVAINRNAVDS